MISFMFALLLGLVQDTPERVPLVLHQEPVLAEDSELRTYAIGRLTGYARLQEQRRRWADGAHLGSTLSAAQELDNLVALRREVRSTTDSLLETVREMIQPPLADSQRVEDLGQGTLAMIATGAQHGWLSGFLEGAAGFHGVVDIQTQIYSMERGTLETLDIERSGKVLGGEESRVLLMRLRDTKADVLNAPRVLVYPFQEATLTSVEQVAYIRDYEIKVLPEQQVEIADPVIDIAESGIIMTLRGIPLSNGLLGVEAKLDYSTLRLPIPTLETTLAATGQKVTIQLPEITKVRVEGRFDIRPGETLAIATTDPTGESEVLVLLRALRVNAEEAPSKAKGDR